MTDWDERLSAIDLSKLTYVRRGILYAGKDPQYIIESVRDQVGTWVFAYNISEIDYKRSKGKVIRKAYVELEPKRFGKTLYAQLSKERYEGSHKRAQFQEREAVFVSPVILGQSSITGEHGMGFAEREPQTYNNREHKYTGGDLTGAFILLSQVKWDGNEVANVESMIKSMAPANHGGVYDL